MSFVADVENHRGMKVHWAGQSGVHDAMQGLGRAFSALKIEVESVIFDVKRSKYSGYSVVRGVESILQETVRQIKKFF